VSLVFDARKRAEHSKRSQEAIAEAEQSPDSDSGPNGSPPQDTAPDGVDAVPKARSDAAWAPGTKGTRRSAFAQQAPLVRSLLRAPRLGPAAAAPRGLAFVQPSAKTEPAAAISAQDPESPTLDIESPALEPTSAGSTASPILAPILQSGLTVSPSLTDRHDSEEDRHAGPSLIDKLRAKLTLAWWPSRLIAFAGLCLLGGWLPYLAGPEQVQATSSRSPDDSASAGLPGKPANSSESRTSIYSADPQDTGSGQLITVAAQPGQTLKQLSLLYGGHFDSGLLEEIRSLNPQLKDPDHLQAGQLIRIPLPPGTLKRATVITEAASISKP